MQYKSSFLAVLLVLAIVLPAHAEKWFEYSHEDGVVGNDLPDAGTPNPYDIEDPGLGETAKYASDAIRSKYAEFTTRPQTNTPCNTGCPEGPTTDDCQCSYMFTVGNPSGTYGTAFSEGSPLSLVTGTTYYLGGFFRFERIDGADIWHDTSNPDSFNKHFEAYGTNLRIMIQAGWAANTGFSGSWDHKFTFTAWGRHFTFSGLYDGYVPPNYGGYNITTPYQCDYETWYAVVLEWTYQTDGTGVIRLYINGTKTTDVTSVDFTAGAALQRLQGFGTIAQPAYDAPQHKIQFDNLIFTDSWSDITAAGLDQDPEAGGSSTPKVQGISASKINGITPYRVNGAR